MRSEAAKRQSEAAKQESIRAWFEREKERAAKRISGSQEKPRESTVELTTAEKARLAAEKAEAEEKKAVAEKRWSDAARAKADAVLARLAEEDAEAEEAAAKINLVETQPELTAPEPATPEQKEPIETAETKEQKAEATHPPAAVKADTDEAVRKARAAEDRAAAEKRWSDAAKAKAEAEKAKAEAEAKAKKQAEDEKAAEQARAEAERTRQEAEQAKAEAERTRQEAEQAKAEKRKSQVTKFRLDAERARYEAEKAKLEAEKTKSEAEKARQEAEKARLEAEKARLEAERIREEIEQAAQAEIDIGDEPTATLDFEPEEPLETLTLSEEKKPTRPSAPIAFTVPTKAAVVSASKETRKKGSGAKWIGAAAAVVVLAAAGWFAKPLFLTESDSQASSGSDSEQLAAGAGVTMPSIPGAAAGDSVGTEESAYVAMPLETEDDSVAVEDLTPAEDVSEPPTETLAAPQQVARNTNRNIQNPAESNPEQTTTALQSSAPPPSPRIESRPTPPPATRLIGTITDRRTGDPIQDAVVAIPGTSLFATTNSAGRYSIETTLTGMHPVSVSSENYPQLVDSVFVTAGQNNEFDFTLSGSPTALGPDEELAEGQWQLTDQSVANELLGRQLVAIDGLWIESIAKPTAGGRTRIRVAQLTDEGERVVLTISRSGPAVGVSRRVTALRTVPPSEVYPLTTGTASIGGLLVTAKTSLSEEELRTLLTRLVLLENEGS